METGILAGALDFIRMNADNNESDYGRRMLNDIFWIVQKFSETVSNEMTEIELEYQQHVNEIAKGTGGE